MDRYMNGNGPVLDLKSPVLQRLLGDWEARRRGRLMPARADFDPVDLKYVLGNLSLIDVLYDPRRYRFRLHATIVAERMGFDLTGKELEAMPDRQYSAVVRRHYDSVVAARSPIAQPRDRLMTDARVYHCEVLALPLGDDGETVDRIMSAFVWF
jgi:hypothetical protein